MYVGDIRVMHAGPAVAEAFQKQSEADMDHFLRLRAREFAVNGLLLIVVPGAMGDSVCGQAWFDSINDAASAMAREGNIDASLLEDFMIPVYNATEDVSRSPPHCWLCEFTHPYCIMMLISCRDIQCLILGRKTSAPLHRQKNQSSEFEPA